MLLLFALALAALVVRADGVEHRFRITEPPRANGYRLMAS
jgi:hypothetical protein